MTQNPDTEIILRAESLSLLLRYMTHEERQQMIKYVARHFYHKPELCQEITQYIDKIEKE